MAENEMVPVAGGRQSLSDKFTIVGGSSPLAIDMTDSLLFSSPVALP